MLHIIILVPKLEGNKRIKTAGFILQLTQSFHMINPVMVGLYMAIQQSGIAMHSQLMGSSVNRKPSIRIYLVVANLFTDFRVKNFCSTAGKRV